MQRYYRIHPGDEDPQALLDPSNQKSESWGGSVRGRCDKCGGTGSTMHECESCAAEPDRECPACGGVIRYEFECPACHGTGEIDETSREGVSVFPDEDGLYRYMIKRDADLAGCRLVVLEGEPSPDEDFDADEGALLIRPERIVDTRAVDSGRIERLRRTLAESGERG